MIKLLYSRSIYKKKRKYERDENSNEIIYNTFKLTNMEDDKYEIYQISKRARVISSQRAKK